MMRHRILIGGIGNIFLGDDAFGVEVARELAARPMPPEVRVVDFGIRGFDLAYALFEGYDTAILIDAAPRGTAPPGTLYLIEPETPDGAAEVDTHAMDPVKVLRWASASGGSLPRVLLVGCEPDAARGRTDMSMELSQPVRSAVGRAAALVESLVYELLASARQPQIEQDVDPNHA